MARRLLSIILTFIIAAGLVFIPCGDAEAAGFGAPDGLEWGNAMECKWNTVSGATEYKVKLYKKVDNDNALLAEKTVTEASYDFRSTIRDNGDGTYYFTVQAVRRVSGTQLSTVTKSQEVYIITYYSAFVTAPMPGNLPEYEMTSGDEIMYEACVDSKSNGEYFWKKAGETGLTDSTFMAPGEKFEKGKTYYVLVKYTPHRNYRLLPMGACARLNGKSDGALNIVGTGESKYVCILPLHVRIPWRPLLQGFTMCASIVSLMKAGLTTG